MKRVAEMLRRETGLDATALGPSAIERTLRARMAALGMADETAYCTHALATRAEWEELVETVIVRETWFYRDPAAFRALAELCRQSVPSSDHPRILSAACATGEEPYTIAMTLLDAGVPAEHIQIDALDLSRRALARARAAVYTRNSFRGEDLAYRERYFKVEVSSPQAVVSSSKPELGTQDAELGTPWMTDSYHLHPRVRACVNFHHGNLLDGLSSEFRVPGFETHPPCSGFGLPASTGERERRSPVRSDPDAASPRTGSETGAPSSTAPSTLNSQLSTLRPPYDFIFCRNLLIYQNRATQVQTLRRLRQLLAPHGVLFLGPAEVAIAVEHGLAPLGLPLAFAVRDGGRQSVVSSRKADVGTRDSELGTRNSERGTRNAERHPAGSSSVPSAQVFYEQAQTEEARGDLAAAAAAYRKALYLEPDHYESLTRLTELLERAGEAGWQNLKRRAERVREKSGAEKLKVES